MIRVITVNYHRRNVRETWETRGHWAERPDGTTFWFVEQWLHCLKVEPIR